MTEEEENKYRSMLRKAQEEYDKNPNKKPVDPETLEAMLKEVDTFELVGDNLVWLN